MLFSKSLEKLGVNKDQYLEIARNVAYRNGYDPELLSFCNDEKHKLSYNGIKFGANGYFDFILYTILHRNIADQKRDNYRKRSYDVMIKSQSKYSPASLSYNILWD